MMLSPTLIGELSAQVERDRNLFAHVGSNNDGLLLKTVDECLASFRSDWEEFDKKWPDSGRPFRVALDLASDTGVFPFLLAKHVKDENYAHKEYPVEWYTTDGPGERLFLLRTMLIMQQNMLLPRLDREDVLFADSNGNGGYPKDTVLLGGLSQEKYNGRKGVVRGKDPKDDNRVSVKLNDGRMELISLKPSNLAIVTEAPNFKQSVTFDQALAIDKDLDTFDKLLSWSLEMDVISEGYEWYSILRRPHNLSCACCLVTCANLLVRSGDENPELWKKVLFVAGEALGVGGFFIHLDTDKYGAGFGDQDIMRKAGMEEVDSPMELVKIEENPIGSEESTGDNLILVVWKKMGDVQDYQKQLEYFFSK